MSAIHTDGLPPGLAAKMEDATESAMTRQTVDAHSAGKKTVDRATAAQFEAIFLRKILSSLQKTANVPGGESAGGSVYSSMVTDGLADTIARNGGIGLQDALMRAMGPPGADGKPTKK